MSAAAGDGGRAGRAAARSLPPARALVALLALLLCASRCARLCAAAQGASVVAARGTSRRNSRWYSRDEQRTFRTDATVTRDSGLLALAASVARGVTCADSERYVKGVGCLAASRDAGLARSAAEVLRECRQHFDRNERLRRRREFNALPEEERLAAAAEEVRRYTECKTLARDPSKRPAEPGGFPTHRLPDT